MLTFYHWQIFVMQNDWFSSDLYMHIPELGVPTLHYPLMSSYSPYYWSHSCFQTASIVLILWLLKMLYIINIFTLLTNMYVCICSYVHVTVYIWRSESSLWKCLLFFPPCGSNIKFKWSGLAHGAILVLEGFIVFLHWRDEFTFLLRLYKGSSVSYQKLVRCNFDNRQSDWCDESEYTGLICISLIATDIYNLAVVCFHCPFSIQICAASQMRF